MKTKNRSQQIDFARFVIPFTLAAVVVFAVVINVINQLTTASSATLGQTTISGRTIGYIGCSNTSMSVQGYQSVNGNKNLFWNVYDTGGKNIDVWANPGSTIWKTFDQQIATYGQPAKIWVQFCENIQRARSSYDQVKKMLTNLRTHAPTANFYMSGMNSYDPTTLCSFMGTSYEGYTDTISWRDQAVSAGLGLRGPDVGPLTASLVLKDGCHPNIAGRVNPLGQQLVNFFDVLP